MAGGRSQRHMREQTATYDADSSGQEVPQHVTTIPAQATGTTLNVNFSTYFEGYPRVYSGTNLPTSSTINATTGVVTGTVAVSAWPNVSITVTNAFGAATSNTFTWTVT